MPTLYDKPAPGEIMPLRLFVHYYMQSLWNFESHYIGERLEDPKNNPEVGNEDFWKDRFDRFWERENDNDSLPH